MASTFRAMEKIDEILADFDKSEKKQVLKALAEKYGLASEGGERAKPRPMVRGTSSLGTMIEVDLEEVDKKHTAAMEGHEDDDVPRGGGIFG